MNKIDINCEGSKYINISELKDFQGNLKTLQDDQFIKLKNLILNRGFCFPVFIWNNFIINGHQRIFVVRKLIEEGYIIDDIPCVEIFAKDEKEAAEKLLMENSHFAQITQEGFMDFIVDKNIDNEIFKELEFIDIDLENMFGEVEINEDFSEPESSIKENKCPKCGYEW